MDRIRQAAQVSILRALGFTALAIGTFMIGFSFEPALCFGAGAALTGIAAAVLWWKGAQAPRRWCAPVLISRSALSVRGS